MITVQARATLRGLGNLRNHHGKVLQETIAANVEQVLQESLRLVPKDTFELAKSARKKVTGKGFKTKGEVSYNTPYAWVVHEDPSMTHDAPTQYKYLTTAIDNCLQQMKNNLKKKLTAKVEGV